jgi:hypothetical protein
MSKPKILVGFTRYSDSALIVKAQEIITHMTNNPRFSKPVPAIADITKNCADFEASVAIAQSGSKTDTAIKNQKREVLENALGNLGLYVQANGNNDESTLLSSGFDLKKDKSPVGTLPKPENLKIMPGNGSGTLKVSVNSIDGADSYLFEYALMPITDNSEWVLKPSSKANISVSGLESGKQYAFKVAALGSNPDVVFSDIASSFVL